jgi:hypothetical protein
VDESTGPESPPLPEPDAPLLDPELPPLPDPEPLSRPPELLPDPEPASGSPPELLPDPELASGVPPELDPPELELDAAPLDPPLPEVEPLPLVLPLLDALASVGVVASVEASPAMSESSLALSQPAKAKGTQIAHPSHAVLDRMCACPEALPCHRLQRLRPVAGKRNRGTARSSSRPPPRSGIGHVQDAHGDRTASS